MASVEAPYGSWRSPITSDAIVARSIGLSEPRYDGSGPYWLEHRPGSQSGDRARVVIVRRDDRGQQSDVFDASFSARNTVHEYGGGAYTAADGVVYFSNFLDDGQLYGIPPGGAPKQITATKGLRYADLVFDAARNRLICIREDHTALTVKNEIVAIALDGQGTAAILATGNDFYSSPKISADGQQLAWLTWNFPNMPWTSTQLWTARFDTQGLLAIPEQVAGAEAESIFQPEWSPNGILYFVSDISGWWNLYRWLGDRREPVAPMEADFGQAQWVFGLSTYAFESSESLVCAYVTQGLWKLASIQTTTLEFRAVDLPFQDISYVRAKPGLALFCGGSPKKELAVVQVDLRSRELLVLQSSVPERHGLDPYFSMPMAIEFPTSAAKTAYAFYYPPANPDFTAPREELPPLLVKSHGGPVAATSNTLDLRVQYWTSRGFGVVDVNYGGSTGYGREYRFRLEHQWGVVDVDDCVNAAEYLVHKGLVDREKLAISGGSAGGYTTLSSLTFRKLFKAGASYYGIGDLEKLAQDTHKFEAHDMDWLIGPYPAEVELYRRRSPINHVRGLDVPVIFFQGEDDLIVPMSQSAAMTDALKDQGVPFAYLLFQGEQHGFRNAQNIKRALDAELLFYSVHLLHLGLRF
jgi:dipeptidyl aminopeptidase/acylaminoacyl peptidase